jgi:hypothetical protein
VLAASAPPVGTGFDQVYASGYEIIIRNIATNVLKPMLGAWGASI